MPVTITRENPVRGSDARINVTSGEMPRTAATGGSAHSWDVPVSGESDSSVLTAKFAECFGNAVETGCGSVFVDASGRGFGVPSEMVYRAVVAAAEELPCYGDVYVSYYSGDGAMELLDDGLLPGDADLAVKGADEAERHVPEFDDLADEFSDRDVILYSKRPLNHRLDMPVCACDEAIVREDGAFEVSETFSAALLRLIDEKGMTEAECYKRANVDRRVFSKIKRDPKYMPSKSTATAFVVALGLSVDEANDLLEKAGYTLSRSLLSDVIVIWFLEHGVYDVYRLNIILYNNGEQPIGFRG